MNENAQPRVPVRVGDSLYFTGPGGVRYGRLLAHGKHGAILDIDGTHTPVRWEHILGHRERAAYNARIVDQGEDGAIVEDESGEKAFVAGLTADQLAGDEPEDEPEDKPQNATPATGWESVMAKSTVLFFVKAVGQTVANRPGLSLQQETDRMGHTIRRWKKTNHDQPAPERQAKQEQAAPAKSQAKQQAGGSKIAVGATVDFHGHADGKPMQGKVVAAGKDGVTVKGADGQEHRVKHGDYRPGGVAKPDWEPHAEGEARHLKDLEKHKDAAKTHHESMKRREGESDEAFAARSKKEIGPRRVVPGAYVSPVKVPAGVPKNADQPLKANTVEALYAQADEALGQYRDWAGKVAEDLGAAVYDINKKQKPENKAGIQFIIGPIKGMERTKEKAEEEAFDTGQSNPEYTAIKDIVRGTIAVDKLEEVQTVWAALEKSGMTLARQPKDRFRGHGFACEYRDIMLNVKMPNGHITELQINCKEMLEAKNVAHKLYEKSRTMQADAKQQYGGVKHAPAEVIAKLDELERRQTFIYRKAWAKITHGKALVKSLGSDTILLVFS